MNMFLFSAMDARYRDDVCSLNRQTAASQMHATLTQFKTPNWHCSLVSSLC